MPLAPTRGDWRMRLRCASAGLRQAMYINRSLLSRCWDSNSIVSCSSLSVLLSLLILYCRCGYFLDLFSLSQQSGFPNAKMKNWLIMVWELQGHPSFQYNTKCHYDLQKYSFTIHVVNMWNIIPKSVTSANSVDKFWR